MIAATGMVPALRPVPAGPPLRLHLHFADAVVTDVETFGGIRRRIDWWEVKA